MRKSDAFFLVLVGLLACCADIGASVVTETKRNLRAYDTSIFEDGAVLEERGIGGNVESALKKSASMSKLKSFNAAEAEVSKVKALLKKTPSLGKYRALSMKEAEIKKVQNMVAQNPELRRATSLVSNPGKLTKADLKKVEQFAKEHPKEGSSLMRSLFLISGLVVILVVGATVSIAALTSGKEN
ncbi:unnamed protein product [Phytophthora fragariaefolia]|uniref:Unnamed protein product n=1 Tax=Phytophthora fragariaefolia TaxID=1490495 RepID=A0A9W6Y3D6_9STRA|nr:unnamed protein product [Phytophthora fragariaefolia]